MRRSFLRQALVVLAAGALFLPMAVYHGDTAQAASIFLPSNCSLGTPDGNGNITVSCQNTGGPSAPGNCSIQYVPSSSVAANTLVTMTANCNTGAPFTSYAWTGGFVASQTTNPASGTATTPVSGTVTVSNSVGPTVVNWSVSIGGGGGGGPVDTSACAALGLTARVIPVAWGINTVVVAPSFGPNEALIIQFTTSSVTTSSSKGNISAVEYQGTGGTGFVPRAGTLSASPCDFTNGLPKVSSGGQTAYFNGINPSISFTVNNPLKNYPTLLPNTPYYLNITNIVPAPPQPGGTQQCSQSSCPMLITLTKPVGT